MFIHNSYAHKVNVFAYAENGKIKAEGYFVDGSKCKNSLIEVIDNKTGEKLLEGSTNDAGKFSFDIPRVTSIKLILHAGTGHRNEYVLSEKEIKDSMPTPEKAAEKQKTGSIEKRTGADLEKKPPEQVKNREARDIRALTNVNPSDLEASIEKVIDAKLQPIISMLVKLQEKSEKPGLTEILGGIGYIIGILGIIAYFMGRSIKQNSNHDK